MLLLLRLMFYELSRGKTNKVACAPSEDSDQPGHSPSLGWEHSHFVGFIMRWLMWS